MLKSSAIFFYYFKDIKCVNDIMRRKLLDYLVKINNNLVHGTRYGIRQVITSYQFISCLSNVWYTSTSKTNIPFPT